MTCPLCQKNAAAEFAPFCSRHCQNIDLLKWIREEYRIPVTESPLSDDDAVHTDDDMPDDHHRDND